MYASKLVFSQVIDHLPIHTFGRCVVRYQGNRYVKSFSCLDQYLCMAFAQLTYRESLRAIEACLRAQKDSSTIWVSGAVSPKVLSPMQTRHATGASTPTQISLPGPLEGRKNLLEALRAQACERS